jgi:hypothetical protein
MWIWSVSGGGGGGGGKIVDEFSAIHILKLSGFLHLTMGLLIQDSLHVTEFYAFYHSQLELFVLPTFLPGTFLLTIYIATLFCILQCI